MQALFRRCTSVPLAAITAAVFVMGLAGPAAAQQAVRLGTASIGSSFYVIAVAMSKLVQLHAGINVSVESLGGSDANLFGLGAGRVDFAMVSSGAAFDAYHGNPPFEHKRDVRLVIQGQPTLRWFMVRNGSGIKNPQDLIGKTISSKRRPMPELAQMMGALIKLYHLPSDRIHQVSSVTLSDIDRAFRAGTIDGAAMPFALHQPVTTRLFADDIISPLILSKANFDKLIALLPNKFMKFRVPANHFEHQPKAFWVLEMTTQLTASLKTPADQVYEVTKAILGHHKEFMTYHSAARYWTVANTLKDPKVPFHPGAIRYFKEIGAWTPALAELQARLLKKQ